MLCGCHGEPAYWHKDPRRIRGGYWRCAVKQRELQRGYYRADPERKRARQRHRYDSDFVHRIGKNLHDNARRRRGTIERRQANLNEEG